MIIGFTFLACSPTEVAPEPVVAPVPAAPPEPAPSDGAVATGDSRFVHASSLNVRAAPEASAALRGTLSINSEVAVLATKPEWAQVRVSNGTEGWVAAKFLAAERLTAVVASENARNADTAAEAVSWAQRAAAIDGSREVLEQLREAYAKAGDADAAETVGTQLAWPHRLLPVTGTADGIRVEWEVGYGMNAGPIPENRWMAHGLDPSETWWLLPDVGPAVQARVARFAVEPFNECAGDDVRFVELEPVEPLPEGRFAVVASRGAPPAVWREAGDAPALSHAEALERVGRFASERAAAEDVQFQLGPSGKGWRGFVSWSSGEYNELGASIYDRVEVRVVDGEVVEGDRDQTTERETLHTERDVTGNGHLERVLTDGCTTWVLDDEGHLVKGTGYRCCGC